MGDTNANRPAVSTDVLLILYGGKPNTAWEASLQRKCPVPGRLEVRWANPRRPDGTFKKPSDFDSSVFEDVTMLFTYQPVPDQLVPKLRFVQLSSAGSDLWANHPKYLDRNVVFCTSSGSNTPQIAEWVIGAWLRFQHEFPLYDEQQKQSLWKPASFIQDSFGARVGILGYGAIGRQVARVCTALGMEVLAFTSTARDTPESRRDRAFSLPGLGDPEGALPARWMHGTTREAVDDFLAQDLDMLVLALPLTRASEKLIGRAQFEILSAKRTFLVNIARGPIVDTGALVEALEGGKIRGAALDVTDPEPLPGDHPLWKARNCFVTPHVSWQSRTQLPRCLDILASNVERLLRGEVLVNELKREASPSGVHL